MTTVLLSVVAVLLVATVALLVALLVRRPPDPSVALAGRLDSLERSQSRAEDAVRQELAKNREEASAGAKDLREEVAKSLKGFGDSADKRLSESFQRVSENLEAVHKGLGEMQTLATGVGDLKKILSNVKTRGTWGEVSLGELLNDVLTIDQYDRNIATRKGSSERVEFAIRLPGAEGDGDSVVWLPIDAKFPQEDYHRLVEASERGAADEVEAACRQLEQRVRLEAKKIRDKYVNPPATTDFAILFLPTEGLFAEVSRRPGLLEALQRDARVVVSGPTTLAALLNSLQMGFQTLAIQKSSSEVWKLLRAVKTQFGKFGDQLDRVHKKLGEATNSLEDASRKTRHIEGRLRKVEELPAAEAQLLLGGPEDEAPADS